MKLIDPDELERVLRPILTDESCPLHIAAEIDMNLDLMPKVDVVTVRHGRWEWNGEAFICSACGNGHKGQPTIMGQPMFEFCPMCGADMRKDGEAHD